MQAINDDLNTLCFANADDAATTSAQLDLCSQITADTDTLANSLVGEDVSIRLDLFSSIC